MSFAFGAVSGRGESGTRRVSEMICSKPLGKIDHGLTAQSRTLSLLTPLTCCHADCFAT